MSLMQAASNIRSPLILCFSLCLSVTFSACLQPPQNLKPQVLTEREIAVVGYVKKGKALALSGRAKKAEEYFYKALKIKPDEDSILNDLGYVLLSQDRTKTAIRYFEYSLRLNPENRSARENLARAYYKDGRLLESRKIYSDLLLETEAVEGASDLGKLSSLHRNIAIVDLAYGDLESAVCHSEKAFQLTYSLPETEQHIRLLLSLEEVNGALGILQSTIQVHRERAPAGVMFDYGVALLALGNKALSKQTFARILSSPGVATSTKLDAKLLNLLASSNGETEEKEEVSEGFNELYQQYPGVCQSKLLVNRSYLPLGLVDQTEDFISQQCNSLAIL